MELRNKIKHKFFNRLLWTAVGLFLLMNIVAFFHAYKFTHFSENVVRTKSPEELSFFDKLKLVFTGIDNPRPESEVRFPKDYRFVVLDSYVLTHCWFQEAENANASVILCHGYATEKSSLLEQASYFLSLGYNVLLLDFMGCGSSEGDKTSIGFHESEQVKAAYDFMMEQTKKPVYLYGTSMGAVAIMKSVQDYRLQPLGIILECPFGSLHQTVKARFDIMGVPTFPMATLLVFWGGVQHGFSGFLHNPIDYAKSIVCPTLLLYGEQDVKVSRAEINAIYEGLRGPKILKTFENAGHDDYLLNHRQEWMEVVQNFMNAIDL